MTLYVLLTGDFPFRRDEDEDVSKVARLQREFTRCLAGDWLPISVRRLVASDHSAERGARAEPGHSRAWQLARGAASSARSMCTGVDHVLLVDAHARGSGALLKFLQPNDLRRRYSMVTSACASPRLTPVPRRCAQASPECQNLVVRMLQPNPARRLTLSEVMAHPWFQQDLPPHLATLNARLLQVSRRGRLRLRCLALPPLTPYVRRHKTCGPLSSRHPTTGWRHVASASRCTAYSRQACWRTWHTSDSR